VDRSHSFGYWLRRRRKALDLTQADLARQVSCSLDLIQKIEADARRPSRQLADRLAICLGLNDAERAAFIQAARAERSVDRLPLPAQPLDAPLDALPQGTITLLFCDIDGNTRLWEQHPRAMPALLDQYDAVLREQIAAYRGLIFSTLGDSVRAVFARAPEALAAALAIQQALIAAPLVVPERPRVRMALHSGSAETRAGAYVGLTFNRAAQLLRAGHGEQILLSFATEELLRDELPHDVTLRDLGTHQLPGLSLPERIFQVVAPNLPLVFPALATLDAHPTNLPAQPTALIGREQEVATAIALLERSDVRLLTVTGPGGVGKTRLSLQIAVQLSASFPDGVYFVDLAPLREPERIGTAIARTLGLREAGDQPLEERLRDYLRNKRMLLLLDNVEHLLDGAVLAAALLAATSQLKVLATSRTRLRLRGEHVVALQPLALPEGAQLPAAHLTQYAAVALFIARAREVAVDFEVTNTTAPAVAAICVQLDGLPLAIELAAARIRLFPPEALLQRLSNLQVLRMDGPRDAPARQRTLRATIAWSYALLDARTQVLFRRLGVFVGACALDAIAAVCGANEQGEEDVLDALAALVDHSLLRRRQGLAGEPRFSLLETIRAYAQEQLASSGEATSTRRRHAAYYLALAEEAEQGLRGPHQREWLRRLDQELDNLRAVLAWSQTAEGDATIGLRLAAALWWLWYFRGYFHEGRRWLQAVLALPAAESLPSARAKALASAGLLAWAQGDLVAARAWLSESVELGRALGDPQILAFALLWLAWQPSFTKEDTDAAAAYAAESLALYRALGSTWDEAHVLLCLLRAPLVQGDTTTARRLGEQSLALFRARGDSWGQAWALANLGFERRAVGEDARAVTLLQESLAHSRELQDPWASSTILCTLGHLARTVGDDGEASAYYRESLGLFEKLGDTRGVAVVRHNQALLALRQGKPEQAAAFLREGIARSRGGGNLVQVSFCLAAFGGVAILQGQPERAARLLAAAAANIAAAGISLDPPDQAEYDGYLALARAQLDEATYAASQEAGRAMTVEQAVEDALEGDTQE
jgi:predicted ATPase/class 3 adenylate cyclase